MLFLKQFCKWDLISNDKGLKKGKTTKTYFFVNSVNNPFRNKQLV